MTARNPVFDIAKGAGVILVILGHLNLPFWIINLIYFFHMPLFVILSGYFHKPETIQKTAKSSLKLFCAYLFYGIFFICLSGIISGSIDLRSLLMLLLAKPASIWAIPYFGIFWFIVTLMIIRIIAHLLPLNGITLAISTGLFFVVNLLQKKGLNIEDLPFAVSQAGTLFCFYVFGYLSKGYVDELGKKRWFFYLAFIILSSLSIVFANGLRMKLVNYHQLSLFNPVISFLLAILGSVSLIFSATALAKKANRIARCFQSIGEFSFIYFALHLFVFAVLSAGLIYLNINSFLTRIFMILPATLIICRVTVILLLRLKKITPVFANILLLK